MVPPWFDASWTDHVLDSTAVLHDGQPTLSVTFGAWTALCFDDNTGIAPGTYDTLSFDIQGGTNTNPDLAALLYFDNRDWGSAVALASYCDGGSIAPGVWTHCAVPLAALGQSTQTITEVAIQEVGGETLSAMAITDLQVQAGGASDGGAGLDAGPPPPVDAGAPLDAGTPADASAPPDASAGDDAGAPADASTPVDASETGDAGTDAAADDAAGPITL